MEKTIKKSYGFVFVLAILLAFALKATPVVANSEGSLTIRKFDVSRYENLKESTGGEGDRDDIPADATQMADVEFKVEKLLVELGDAYIPTSTPVDPKFTARMQRTDSKGETKFNNLPIGYYLVTESTPDGYDTPGDGKFVVAVPTQEVDKNGVTTLNYDVVVYPKSQKVVVKKVLNSKREVIGVGDIVNWTVNYPMFDGLKKVDTDSSGKQTTQYGKNFFITDEMDTRLDYVDNSAKFKYFDATSRELSLKLSEGVDYNISYDATSHILTITFTDNIGTKKIADANVANIELTIDTAINESALATIEAMTNNARIKFDNHSGDPFEHVVFPPGTNPEDSRVPKVYLGTIDILKVDSKDEKITLAGATFALAKSEKQAKKGEFERTDIVTDSNGVASISAIGEGTYYLVETKAPEGYKLSSEPIKVTVANDSSMRITNITISNVKDKISPTVTPEPTTTTKPGETKKPDATKKPITTTTGGTMSPKGGAKTGDTTQILGIVILAAASLGLIGYLVKRKKKQAQ